MKTYFIFSFLFSIVITQSCNTGDRQIQQRCFNLVNQQLSWSEARNYCHNRNSYLATVPEQTTDSYLASYARTSFNINEGNFWIGLYRNSTTSKWQWDDGTPFAWNNFENPNLNYVAESIKNGKWNTFVAETRLNFVCSYYPNGAPTEPVTGSTEPPHWTTTESETVTPTESYCNRNTNTTILAAYSNDLDAYDVNYLRSSIVFYNTYHFYGYTKFANIRFDVRDEEEIQYHSDLTSFNASFAAHMPDPSLGYANSATGSDVFKVLQKFLNNKQATICGALVYIVAKRYPNENALTDLISQLRANHVFVYIVAHDYPSGGTNPKALFEVATKTNGFCVFNSGVNFWVSVDDLSDVNYRKYQFQSQSFTVSGMGRLELPVFQTPNPTEWSEQMLVVITIQDHSLKNFISLNYTIESTDGSFVWTGPDQSSGWPRFGTGILAQPNLNGTTSYKWTIDYHYSNSQPQIIETRLYSNFYHDFLPLPGN